MNSIKDINIIPEPVSITISTGKFNLTDKTAIYTNKDLLKISKLLKNLICLATGFNLEITEITESLNSSENSIILQLTENNADLGSEGYLLSVTLQQVNISANKPAGIFYGIQTLRQLLPVNIESKKKINNIEWEIPCLTIEDIPRFSWRGYMLDEARHFHGKEEVKKLLDLLAFFKMNIFHWHLTDDQGWRIQINKYPKLTEIGSKRLETQVGGYIRKKKDAIPHSGYYTKEEIKEIVAYAKERFITIVPEIDLPGHTRAALASYPKLGCKGYSFKVPTNWGIYKDVLCVGKEEVFEFIQNILKEIMDLFPSKIIHIGGDEVPKIRWRDCPDCQLRIENESLKNENELQEYFTNRIAVFLATFNRRLIVWSDIVNERLEENAICQYWFPSKMKGIEYKFKNRDVIMSNFDYTYLDRSYLFISLRKAYNYNPIIKELKKEYKSNILGLEACMWGELTPNVKLLEFQTFPRLIAYAETGWTPILKKNFISFQDRLDVILKRLDIMGVNYAQKKKFQPTFLHKLSHLLTFLIQKLTLYHVIAMRKKTL